MIIANSSLCASLVICHLISNAHSWNNCWLHNSTITISCDGSTLLNVSLYCRFTLNSTTIIFRPYFNMFICFYYPGVFISERLSETLPFSRKNVRKGLCPLFFIFYFFINLFFLSFLYSFSYSVIHLLIGSLIRWFIHSFNDSLIPWFMDFSYLSISLFILFIYHLLQWTVQIEGKNC